MHYEGPQRGTARASRGLLGGPRNASLKPLSSFLFSCGHEPVWFTYNLVQLRVLRVHGTRVLQGGPFSSHIVAPCFLAFVRRVRSRTREGSLGAPRFLASEWFVGTRVRGIIVLTN